MWATNLIIVPQHQWVIHQYALYTFSLLIHILQDHPMLEWLPQWDLFLAEILWHESHRNLSNIYCYCCRLHLPQYRYSDCYGDQLTCGECTWAVHIFNPLYCILVHLLFQALWFWLLIQWWNSEFFECTNLKTLGLRIQLGHLDGSLCVLLVPAFNDNFVVLDDHGVHKVGLNFCGCTHAQIHTIQILQHGWYPAMVNQPKTAATFQVLECFHLVTFKSKASPYEFYYSLAQETNNIATYIIKDHHMAFLRMVWQWRHLVMLKRAGCGHDPPGVSDTSQGRCVAICPACPQPGKNLPTNWKSAPEDERYELLSIYFHDATFQ